VEGAETIPAAERGHSVSRRRAERRRGGNRGERTDPFVWGALAEAKTARRRKRFWLSFIRFEIPRNARAGCVIAPNVGPEIF